MQYYNKYSLKEGIFRHTYHWLALLYLVCPMVIYGIMLFYAVLEQSNIIK